MDVSSYKGSGGSSIHAHDYMKRSRVHLYLYLTIWTDQGSICTCTRLYEEVRVSSIHAHDYMKRSRDHLYMRMTIWRGQGFIYRYMSMAIYEAIRGSSMHVHDYTKRSGVHLYMHTTIWRGQGIIYTCAWLYEEVRGLSILSILLYKDMTIWRGIEVHLYMYMTTRYSMKRSGVYLYMYMTVWRGQGFICTCMTRWRGQGGYI